MLNLAFGILGNFLSTTVWSIPHANQVLDCKCLRHLQAKLLNFLFPSPPPVPARLIAEFEVPARCEAKEINYSWTPHTLHVCRNYMSQLCRAAAAKTGIGATEKLESRRNACRVVGAFVVLGVTYLNRFACPAHQSHHLEAYGNLLTTWMGFVSRLSVR